MDGGQSGQVQSRFDQNTDEMGGQAWEEADTAASKVSHSYFSKQGDLLQEAQNIKTWSLEVIQCF